MGLRRKGRELALQTLYALDYQETDSYLGELDLINKYPQVLAELTAEHDAEDKSVNFAEELIVLVLKNIAYVDDALGKHLINWELNRLAKLDKSLLRIAAAEILINKTPKAIIIDEAVEIAKKFCSEKSGKFVNGILHSLATEVEKSNK